jgi:phosphoglycolate phosphatase-like HAD superfamily hydrolase
LLEGILTEVTGHPDPVREQRIHERKAVLFREYTARHNPPLFPGVVKLVTRAGQRYRLAITTGGRREQILFALSGTPIEKAFDALESAEDVAVGNRFTCTPWTDSMRYVGPLSHRSLLMSALPLKIPSLESHRP